MSRTTASLLLACQFLLMVTATVAEAAEFRFRLRSLSETSPDSGTYVRTERNTAWNASETAVIVCDVWDKHHCLNAVRRMEEFVPRMNEVIKEARRHGMTIIHSPSDCMAAYTDHPARQRAQDAPHAPGQPPEIAFWCSKIPSEERAVYPIDQSDGGVDDEPGEHERWAAELAALGRDPGLPWKSQHPLIEIDGERDFISDRGDEVWNILESRSIRNVILVGVHTNMCVLGRPFGLRQMARSGRNVVLMRDMTDCMYNPARWPYVDHFTGNDLVVAHVERFVCPTITSDQILGGQPFVSKYDERTERDVTSADAPARNKDYFHRQWAIGAAGDAWRNATDGLVAAHGGPAWYRCTIRIPSSWIADGALQLELGTSSRNTSAWLNGVALKPAADSRRLTVPMDAIAADDINLLAVRIVRPSAETHLPSGWKLTAGDRELDVNSRLQFRLGDDPSWSTIPLPAKFAFGPDVLYEAR